MNTICPGCGSQINDEAERFNHIRCAEMEAKGLSSGKRKFAHLARVYTRKRRSKKKSKEGLYASDGNKG